MPILRKHVSFNRFLHDKNLSLNAKGLLIILLTTDVENCNDVINYCSDTKETIEDAILELRINKYLRYTPIDKTLDANPIPYDEIGKEIER